MTRRILDRDGHAWPITGTACHICRMPTDPTLDGGPHPTCLPRRRATDDEQTAAVDLLANELGAVEHRPLDRWRVSGQLAVENGAGITTSDPIYLAIRAAETREQLVQLWRDHHPDWNRHYTALVEGRLSELAEIAAQRQLEFEVEDDIATAAPMADAGHGYGPYKVHSFLACIPLMRDYEMAGLVESIRKIGLLQPIKLSADGTTIIDGRCRYLACATAGVEPVFDTAPAGWSEDAVEGHIISANLMRQQLTDAQRKKIEKAVEKHLEEGAA